MPPFTKRERMALFGLALFGFAVPNGVFLYHLFAETGALDDALRNPVALVFVGEAFFLLGLFCWLLRRVRGTSPGWLGFLLMSIAGSMAFSVPALLWLRSRPRKER
jgi:hypothetical protein